jgi:hypothetical protein
VPALWNTHHRAQQNRELGQGSDANERLDAPPWKPGEPVKALRVPANRIQVLGIKPGNYDFKVDGKLVRVITDKDLAPGWVVNQGPQFDQAELLRQTIVKKNELFFYRWRPQNNTYLFLFRKHEQGQNAKEIPEFDPLVEGEEQKIAILRRPASTPWNGSTQPTNPGRHEQPSLKQTARTGGHREPQTPFRPQPVPVFETDPNIEIALWAENPSAGEAHSNEL